MARRHQDNKNSAGCIVLMILILAVVIGAGVFAKNTFFKPGSNKPDKIPKEVSALSLLEEKTGVSTEITVSLTGDFILGTDESFVWDTGFNAYYERYGGAYFLENVRDVFEKDDLTIVNFECTLTEETAREAKQFAFKGEPEFVDVLTTSSVEGANTANNHSHDYGEKSYTDTVETLESHGIKCAGYDKVCMFDVRGIKIGVFGIYELDDHLARIPQMEENIMKLKEQGADLIIGIFHWSNELETSPDLNARTLAHLAIDEGVDLVIGHHPHILQGVETYKGKHIAYSLGNFCFGGNTHPREFETVIYQETFKIKDGELIGSDMNLIPTCISSNWEYNDYKPTIMTGAEGERILKLIEDRSKEIILDFPEDGKPVVTESTQASKPVEDTQSEEITYEDSYGYEDNSGYEYDTGYYDGSEQYDQLIPEETQEYYY